MTLCTDQFVWLQVHIVISPQVHPQVQPPHLFPPQTCSTSPAADPYDAMSINLYVL